MPYLKIQSNKLFSSEDQQSILLEFSQLLSKELGKPEKYIMTSFAPQQEMTFGGSSEPLVFLQLKSIGLPNTQTKNLSEKLCQAVQQIMNIAPERTYIEFRDAPRAFWGWNSTTFE
ncbi:MAG: phenylpyruvate tautomerase MIF-related protein [Marinifilaceae bacterium]